jgi:uncharacterized protein
MTTRKKGSISKTQRTKMNHTERRFTHQPLTRAATDAARVIRGYAAVFDSIADIGSQFLERVQRGAFSRSIREQKSVSCLINHDPSRLVGRVPNTLLLEEDSRGLRFRCDVAATSDGDTLLTLLRRGDWNACSFAFAPVKDSWSRTKAADGTIRDLRTLEDVDLYDVSIVTEPAYSDTSVSADDERSLLRMAAMFPAGPPVSAPLELRTRLQRVADQMSDVERSIYTRALILETKADLRR